MMRLWCEQRRAQQKAQRAHRYHWRQARRSTWALVRWTANLVLGLGSLGFHFQWEFFVLWIPDGTRSILHLWTMDFMLQTLRKSRCSWFSDLAKCSSPIFALRSPPFCPGFLQHPFMIRSSIFQLHMLFDKLKFEKPKTSPSNCPKHQATKQEHNQPCTSKHIWLAGWLANKPRATPDYQ